MRTHPEIKYIFAAVVAGEGLERVGKRYGIHAATIRGLVYRRAERIRKANPGGHLNRQSTIISFRNNKNYWLSLNDDLTN